VPNGYRTSAQAAITTRVDYNGHRRSRDRSHRDRRHRHRHHQPTRPFAAHPLTKPALTPLVIDFAALRLIDASAIAALQAADQTARQRGITVRVVNSYELVQQAHEIAGLHHLLIDGWKPLRRCPTMAAVELPINLLAVILM
jgi:alkylation response protein AidB-like acyl-CoA dehydrogenase